MNQFLAKANNTLRQFSREDEGAQVIEYALIIAVVSITLVAALSLLTTNAPFSSFITRVAACLTGPTCA